jgi:hypothetical protein
VVMVVRTAAARSIQIALPSRAFRYPSEISRILDLTLAYRATVMANAT